ncbi:MAG: HAMP domain-containing sensor histidine kinase [Bacteroidota bacterium]
MKRDIFVFLLLFCVNTPAADAQQAAYGFFSGILEVGVIANKYSILKNVDALSNLADNPSSAVDQSDNTLLYITFFISAVLLLLFGLVLMRNKKIRSANEQLRTKNEEIQKKNEVLKEIHLEAEAQHTEILSQQKELEDLNVVKDKMFSIIAHDFRSPLNTVQGVLNLLHLDALSPEELKAMLPQLSRKVNHSINLLDNLLNWSRTQMNGLRINKLNFDLQPEIEETVGLISQLAAHKGIRIENSVGKENRVYADPDMIQLVVRNLLTNAIKFTTSGGVVRIFAQQEENSIVIAVSDNGVGMEGSYTEQLFRYTGHSTKGTDQEKGTGLGLVLCDEFVRRNGGKIWVESKKDKGTTFYFTLPTAPLLAEVK